ncbi:MAG TPA: hypothetical protein VJ483_07190 [Holophagaceae bacterium]|nr:hypothetical protein [Holophagaceae bacterium]
MKPLEALLPHRAPSILLSEMREITAEGCLALARVEADARYLDARGELPAWVGLELMAQAASAFSGHRNTLSGRPVRVGYLLGTRSFTSAAPSFPIGAELEVEVRVIFLDDSGPSAFRCEIRRSGAVVAQATLKAIEVP